MPVTQFDLDWIAARLLPDIYDINQRVKYDRVTRRLTNLYDEIMKFRITEDTFFNGQHRKVGDVLDFPVGPYRNVLEGGNGLQRIPQFEELAVMTETVPPTATPVPPAPGPVSAKPASVSKISTLAERVKKFHQDAIKGADEVNAMLDAGEPMVANAFDTTVTSINTAKADVQALLDVFKDLPGGNGPLSS